MTQLQSSVIFDETTMRYVWRCPACLAETGTMGFEASFTGSPGNRADVLDQFLAAHVRHVRLCPQWRAAVGEKCLTCGGRGEVPKPPIFVEEQAAYEREKTRLLHEYGEGAGILIRGSEIVGVFADENEALREGYRRFDSNVGRTDVRREPFMVKELRLQDVIVYGRYGPPPGDPCPSCSSKDAATT